MPKPELGVRLASATVGAVFGAVIGLCLAWLLGVYSNTLGAGTVITQFSTFAMAGAAFFGLVGMLVGRGVGTVLGNVFSTHYTFESAELPAWLAFVPVLALAAVVWCLLASAGRP
jgi:hypothetical protein